MIVNPETPIAELLPLYFRNKYELLPVVDNGKLVGILSKENLSSRFLKLMDSESLESINDELQVAEDLMQAEFATTYCDDDIESLVNRFQRENLTYIVAIDAKKHFIKVITANQLYRSILAA